MVIRLVGDAVLVHGFLILVLLLLPMVLDIRYERMRVPLIGVAENEEQNLWGILIVIFDNIFVITLFLDMHKERCLCHRRNYETTPLYSVAFYVVSSHGTENVINGGTTFNLPW